MPNEVVAHLRGRDTGAVYRRLRERSIEAQRLPGGVLLAFVQATTADAARARIEEVIQGTQVSLRVGGEGRGESGEHERSP